MPASVLPSNKPGCGKNAVPQPEPSYAPDGYTRCQVEIAKGRKCNRLIKIGEECQRHKPFDTARPVVTSFDPNEIKGGQEPRKRKLKRLPDHRRKLYRRIRITTCEVCGCDFEHSSMGRTPAKCYDCRKK